jgi:hypothetical protein
MTSNYNLRFAKIPLNFGAGAIPALGFGTLIPAIGLRGGSMIRFMVALAISCLGFQLAVQGQTNPEAMTPERFRELVAMRGDSFPLVTQLDALPFWTNAVVSNVMTYASGKVVREEMTQTARTLRGQCVVFTVQSKFYNQPVNAILAYDDKASALKIYGLYANEHGGDMVTEGTVKYDSKRKTYTIVSAYDDFKETTTGSYTDTEDVAKTVVYKDGALFMTREVITRPVSARTQ